MGGGPAVSRVAAGLSCPGDHTQIESGPAIMQHSISSVLLIK